METKQPTEREQQEMETKQKVESEQLDDTPDNTTGENVSSDKLKILERIWTFCLEHKIIAAVTCFGVLLGGIGTLLLGIAAVLTVIRPNRVEVILPDEYISELRQLERREESLEIEKSLRKVEQNPKASFMNKAIAEIYRLEQVGKIDESIERWHSIADITEGIDNDLTAGAWFSIGYLYLKQAKTEKALSAYNEALRLKPGFANAYTNRGIAYANLEKYEEAIADYSEALRLDPESANAYNNRGNAKSSLRRYEEAIADYSEALRLDPGFTSAYNNRGAAKSDLGRYEEAIADYSEALRLDPESANVYINRGVAKNELGKIEESRSDFQAALRIAEQQGNENLKTAIEKILRDLKDRE